MVADCWRVSLVAFNIKASLIYFYIFFLLREILPTLSDVKYRISRESLCRSDTSVSHIYIFSYIVLGIIVFALNKKYLLSS